MSMDFLIGVADAALYDGNGALKFTGQAAINDSIAVSMEDLEIMGGKSNQLLYKGKHGRKVAVTLEMVDWNMAYIAANLGTTLSTAAADIYAIAECVDLTGDSGTLDFTPIGTVYVEKEDGNIVSVTPVGSTITVSGAGTQKVKATYQHTVADGIKKLAISSETTPIIGKLVLRADKFNNGTGKSGAIEIVIPSFQIDGNFDINLQNGQGSSTTVTGMALSVDGATCADGSVYGYITEETTNAVESYAFIHAFASDYTIAVASSADVTAVGVKGGMYSTIELDQDELVLATSSAGVATVTNHTITGAGAGTATITVTYSVGTTDYTDDFLVTVS